MNREASLIRGRLACWGWKEEGGEKRGEKEAPPPPSPPTHTVVYRMTSAAKRAEAEMCAWKVGRQGFADQRIRQRIAHQSHVTFQMNAKDYFA